MLDPQPERAGDFREGIIRHRNDLRPFWADTTGGLAQKHL